MKYTLDGDGLVSKIVRESSYVDVLLHVIDLDNLEFMQWLEGFTESCRAYGANSREIIASVDMIAKERSVIRKDLGL